MATWCRWRGRFSRMPTSSTRPPRVARTRSTPASPATRRASTRSSRGRSLPASSIRAACNETLIVMKPAARKKRIAVVGAGPAGLACATTAAEAGHRVALFDAAAGDRRPVQSRAPHSRKGRVRRDAALLPPHASSAPAWNCISIAASASGDLGGYDHVVLATGIVPRMPAIPGIDHPKVAGYADIVMGRKVAGARVAIIGAGGIGFDVGEFLTHHGGHDETGNTAPNGASTPRSATAAVLAPTDEREPRRDRSSCCSANRLESRGRPREDDGLDPPHAPQEARRDHAAGRGVRTDRRRGSAHPDRRAKRECSTSTSIVICAGQEPRRELSSPCGRRGCR